MKVVSSKIKLGARYEIECYDKNGNLKWKEDFDNLVPTVGLNKFLDATMKTGLASPAWYVGLKNNGAAAAGDTMASHGTWAEITSYSEANRQVLTLGSVSAGSVNNSASKAEFNMTGTVSVGGVFIVDNNTKGGTTGTLLSAGNFTNGTRDVQNTDILRVTFTMNAAAS